MSKSWPGLPLLTVVVAAAMVTTGVGWWEYGTTVAAGASGSSAGSTHAVPPSAPITPAVRIHRDSLANEGGWQGLNYSNSCSTTCYPADPDVAAGNGYVFEVVNTAYRIWTSTGALVLNASLASLFGTGTDSLGAPEVTYDPSTFRWFACVNDLSKDQIYYAGSESSDPTSTWSVQHFNPPGGDVPTQPSLAVDALNLVVSTDLFKGGVYQGAQLWVANESQLTHGGGVSTWSDTPNPANASLVPANPTGASEKMYLVSDGNGSSPLVLFSLSGSPPGTVTLTGPVEFSGTRLAPPAAVQPESPDVIGTGTGAVESATWGSGTLWAAATVGCTPQGDSALRSCLRLWEISTSTDSMTQEFNWSSGSGRYDYYPALATDPSGDLGIVFEQSSTTLYPGVYATGQSLADVPGSLEPAMSLRPGGGPDNGSGTCALDVCPFGNYSGIAFAPLTTHTFWLVGQYSWSDYATDRWHTWVGSVEVQDAYPVTFSESNLPAGTTWAVTIDGVERNSTSASILVNETNAAYSFSVRSPVAGGAGVQYVAAPASGSYTVNGAAEQISVVFTEQFELTAEVTPVGAGEVAPDGGWFDAMSAVNVSALAAPDYVFVAWSGSGAGNYSGTANPGTFDMVGPIVEEAEFEPSVTFAVTFTEVGLPTGTEWSVVLNGLTNRSTSSTISFNAPNGTYSYASTSPIAGGTGVQFVAQPSAGQFGLAGRGVSETISYVTQYQLSATVVPSGAGTASPSSGWFDAGTVVQVTALPSAGYAFVAWQGSGAGSYTGSNDPASLTMSGPVNESGHLSVVSASAAASGGLGSLPFWVLGVVVVGFVAILLGVLLAGRRRRPPSPATDAVPGPSGGEVPPSVAAPPWKE
jgi:hypothetical protein